MKKWIGFLKGTTCVFLSLFILFNGIVFSAEMVEIYAPDGRRANVPKETLDDYLSVGWYGTYEETVRTIYSMDGRRASVFLDQVSAFLSAGWYETYDETVQRLYALDGRQIVVYKPEVPTYLNLGWHATVAETLQKLYALDGRQIVVYKSEVPAYLNLGWYTTVEETVQRLYALDGRQIVVYKSEVPSYLNLGWCTTIEETVQALYSPDNKTITVYKSEVPSYLACGWTTSKNTRMIALTFDDGPHSVYTNSILDTLETYGVKATFFTLGMQVNTYPSVLKRAKEMGCEIGSHTYSHSDLTASSAGKIQNEINTARDAIVSATLCAPTLFRPPYGNHNAIVRTSAGLPVILWNVDTRDWATRNAEAIVQHVLSNASDGNIILMHDIYASTAEAVKILVPELIKRGYRLVTVSEMAKEKGIQLTNGMVYYSL